MATEELEENGANVPVVVVGAGLAGCLAAVCLAKRGLPVLLLESREDFTLVDAKDDLMGLGHLANSTKRSINLSLGVRGMAALERAGVLEQVMQLCIRMPSRAVHPADGGPLLKQPYGVAEHECLYSVPREQINAVLLRLVRRLDGVQLQFGARVQQVRRDGSVVILEEKGRGTKCWRERTIPARFVIGADGAFSVVRKSVVLYSRCRFEQRFLQHGYKEITIPPTADGRDPMAHADSLHVWPRDQVFMVSMPNRDHSARCTMILPFEGEWGMLNIRTREKALAFFQRFFPDVIPLVPDLVDQFLEHPTSNLASMFVSQYHFEDKILLLGDAAHAMTPFYGQGMNSAFEDVLVLVELLEAKFGAKGGGGGGSGSSGGGSSSRNDLADVFSAFSAQRVASCHALVQLSEDHFTELGTKAGSVLWQAKQTVDRMLSATFPRVWMPYMSMVAFSRMPYDAAVRRATTQNRILAVASLGVAAAAAGVAWVAWNRLARSP